MTSRAPASMATVRSSHAASAKSRSGGPRRDEGRLGAAVDQQRLRMPGVDEGELSGREGQHAVEEGDEAVLALLVEQGPVQGLHEFGRRRARRRLGAQDALGLGHEDRPGNALARRVADRQGDPAVGQLEAVVEVAADLAAGVQVGADVVAGRGRHGLRQEGLLDERGDLQLVVEAPVLLGEQPVAFARVADAAHEQLGGEAVLDEVVLRAALDRLDRDLVVVEVAEDHDRRGLVQGPDEREALAAAGRLGREPQQHRVVGAGVRLRPRVGGGGHRLDGEGRAPRLAQEGADPVGGAGVVLDEEHANDAGGGLGGHRVLDSSARSRGLRR